MRAQPRKRPVAITAPPDGTTLEDVIGDLQSTWGVPQYPQEYRLTIKVAEERDAARTEPVVSVDEAMSDRATAGAAPDVDVTGDGPRREKAPAAPVPVGEGRAQTKGRRRRRRRRGGSRPS